MDAATLRSRSRTLRDLIEPIAANVYFAPEAQAAYAELGLDYGPGYFCSRGGCLGRPPGHVVQAAFAVFSPTFVLPSVETGWSKTTPEAILDARLQGAVASLERILGGVPEGVKRATELLRRAADAGTPEGRPLYAGLSSLGFPGDPLGDLWRAADLVREHRGDSHTCAWVAAGVDACQITLLTELWWRIPLGRYVPTRGFSPDEIAAGIADLEERGLVAGGEFTPIGEALRASIEEATDNGERKLLAAVGDDTEELFALLAPWTDAVLEAKGYPADPRLTSRP